MRNIPSILTSKVSATNWRARRVWPWQAAGQNAFNPLTLYSNSGLGKTHLVQAIGNYVKESFKDKTVLYVSADQFTNQFIDLVKNGSTSRITNFYRTIDVLIVDDIQFFANKDRTQDIFFHTFNYLHQNGKQIIMTSDRPLSELTDMEERLISRFKWGLVADLQMPDLETRIAILEKKLHAIDMELPREDGGIHCPQRQDQCARNGRSSDFDDGASVA